METEQTNTSSVATNASLVAVGSVFEFIRTIGFILVMAFLIRHFLVQPFVVDGSSMEPNFHNQEYILVDKLSYEFRVPRRGDVIVFHPPGQIDNYIKRIIGLPGERVEIRGPQVFVNGTQIPEKYLGDNAGNQFAFQGEVTTIDRILGSNEYFVMGDNRDHSRDSREIGPITTDRIIGRAWVVLFPVHNLTLVMRPSYPAINHDLKQALVHQGYTYQS